MTVIMASIIKCYVGCNSGAAVPQALQVLSCNAETGQVRIEQSVTGVEGTTYFQLDGENKYLYSMVRRASSEGKADSSSAVRFPVTSEGLLGSMEEITELPAEAPCHIALSPDCSRVFAASYVSGSVMSFKADGAALRSCVLPNDDMGNNAKRQTKAHAHFVFCTPLGRNPMRLGVVDLGCDRIRFFDPETLEVDPSLEIKFDSGDGPRHAVWSNDGRFLFVLNELQSSVSVFSFDGKSFRRVDKKSMLPEGFSRWEKDGETLATKAAAIKLTKDGKILMASNRGHDSIAFYSVDTEKGVLELKNIAKLSGEFPRDFELMPGEKFMIVGHKMSNEIQVYAFNRDNCSLEKVGESLACWRPLCFKFATFSSKK
jgi:6-phosphogluconolactonase